MSVVVVVVVVVDLDGDGDGEVDATFGRHRRDRRPMQSPMLSFQRLDVYQRAIEFLALVYDIVDVLPRGQSSGTSRKVRGDGPRPTAPTDTRSLEERRWSALHRSMS